MKLVVFIYIFKFFNFPISSFYHQYLCMFSKFYLFILFEVTIADPRGTGFKGILVQARNEGSDKQLGTFKSIPDGLKGLTCANENDALTHSSGEKKQSVAFAWLPGADYGGIIFRYN